MDEFEFCWTGADDAAGGEGADPLDLIWDIDGGTTSGLPEEEPLVQFDLACAARRRFCDGYPRTCPPSSP